MCIRDSNVNTAPFVISGYLASAGVPVVMISQQDGDWLKSKLSDTLSAQILPTSKKLIQTSSATIELSQADFGVGITKYLSCLLYTSDAADDLLCVDLGGSRFIKKKTHTKKQEDNY